MEHPTKTLPVVSVPEMSPERRLLWEAANEMEKRGWCSGVSFDGRVCTVNAVACAENGGRFGPLGVVGDAALELLSLHIGQPVIRWSDSSGQATVVKTLRDCAVSS